MPRRQLETRDTLDRLHPLPLGSRSGRVEEIDTAEEPGMWRTDSAATSAVAVLIPCHNEAATVGQVVRDFQAALPEATVYVYDNASTDRTAAEAAAAGAVVRSAQMLGKGHVIRQMFADIDAGIYVVADGDDTYDALAAPALISRLRAHQLDMVIGARTPSSADEGAYRRGHRFGNWLLSRSVNWIFGGEKYDMLSGYRALSRRYVKSFPAFSSGFEIETEMTVHALELRVPFDVMPTTYRKRPEESVSKLRTIPDGLRILRLILLLCKAYRPLRFFLGLALVLATSALALSLSVPHALNAWSPTTFLVAGLSVAAAMSTFAGVVTDSLGRSSREIKRMLYLTVRPTHDPGRDRYVGPTASPIGAEWQRGETDSSVRVGELS